MQSGFSSLISGIRFRLTISFIALAIGPLLLISAVLSYTGYRHEKQQSLAFQKEKASRIAVEVNSFFEKSKDRLTDIIRVRGVQGLNSDEVDSILSELVHYESFFEEVSLINNEGLEINKQHRIRLIQKSDLINREKDPVYTIPKKEKRGYVGPIYFDGSTGDPLMDLSIPVINPRDGSFNGILEGSVRFRKIWDLIIANSTDKSEEIYILNSEGRVVAHKNPSVVLRSTTVSKPYTSGVRAGLSGDQIVFAAHQIEMGNLILWVVIEKAFPTAIQGAINAIFIIVLVSIVSLVIAVLLAVPVAGNIVKPIQQLAKSSKLIMAGDFASKVSIKGKGEIAELSLVFNKMTRQLHRLIEELKEEVNVRKAAERSLKISEERYRELAENITEVFWIVTENWSKVIYISPAYEKTWGRSMESLYKDPLSWINAIYDEDKQKVVACIERNIKDASEIIFPEYRIQKPDGEIRWIFARGFPIRDADGSISRVVGIAEDITERKIAEEAVLESNLLMNAIIQSPKEILVFALDMDYRYITFNENHRKAMKALHKVEIKNGMIMLDLLKNPEAYNKAKSSYNRALSGESFSEIQHEPGAPIYWEFQWNPIITETGKVIGLTCFAQNISDRKKSEELIKASLKEKETLLHEIHHRVKNNMQVIVSLLKLQLNNKGKHDVDAILRENMGRVYSMAAIHESLHQSEKLSDINFNAYLQKLSQMLSQTYSVDPGKVAFQIDTPELKLAIDMANPIGLVLNELISNSIKYAFPDDQKGTITIRSLFIDKKTVKLIVADDGIGLPDGFNWKHSESLGLMLVQNLVENQLSGSLDLDNTNGTKFTITFDLNSNCK